MLVFQVSSQGALRWSREEICRREDRKLSAAEAGIFFTEHCAVYWYIGYWVRALRYPPFLSWEISQQSKKVFFKT